MCCSTVKLWCTHFFHFAYLCQIYGLSLTQLWQPSIIEWQFVTISRLILEMQINKSEILESKIHNLFWSFFKFPNTIDIADDFGSMLAEFELVKHNERRFALICYEKVVKNFNVQLKEEKQNFTNDM